ncbi:MAG: neutral/alkaline non-lysosomal ceramidase N-terminal domain-containing protein [Gemmatimonadota bacterium]|nr:neutral/alkaline non-lysosomal ceramidase N-terminal domain-containing protein [Gemmatimonadota bacterium]
MSNTNQLRAGAATVDITPPLGTHLAGSGAGEHRPAETVMDRLFARAVVFESGGRRVCLVILDLTIVTQDYTDRIRAAIAERTGIAPEAIMVQATQTHSAPSLGYFMLDQDFPLENSEQTEYLRGAERAYGDRAAAAAVEAAVEAAGRLQPARIGLGRGVLGDLAFNRRGIRRDGTIIMPARPGREERPFGNTDVCYLEGPMDPEVGVCCVRDLDERPLAFLLHYTCHPVNAFSHRDTYRAVSADWPGAWTREMEQCFGSEAVPLVVNGCCGNINPRHPFDSDYRPDHRRMGRELARMTERIVHNTPVADTDTLSNRVDTFCLPFREIPAERLREVDAILSENPQPPRGPDGNVDPRWFRAASTRSVELCRERDAEFSYEIQAFRIGDLCVIGLPGEPFVEGQLALKTNSPAPYLFPAHVTTHYVGYLPTREAYNRGGHEANEDVTYWAKLAPGCLETVVERARALIEGLFE